MSAAEMVWARPEVEVAADTLARLVLANLVARDKVTLARACQMAGISSSDLRAALARVAAGRWQPPRQVPARPALVPPELPVVAGRPTYRDKPWGAHRKRTP